MNETDPGKNHEESGEDLLEDFKRSYKSSGRLGRKLKDLWWKTIVLSVQLDPEFREKLSDREQLVGLLADSIISPVLYHPDNSDQTLVRDVALAGRWVGYDFRRPSVFGPEIKSEGKQRVSGRIIAFPLPEIIDNSPDQFTSLDLLNPYTLEHLLTVEYPTIPQLIEYGFITETSYAQAYSQVGMYDTYRAEIDEISPNFSTVFRITPKGNTLVFLAKDTGQTRPKKSRRVNDARTILNPAFG